MGPSALRLARIADGLRRIGYDVKDRGDVEIAIPESKELGNPSARYLEVVSEACRQLAQEVKETLDSGSTPLVLGGDHSLAIGTISGVSHYLLESKGLDPGSAPPRLGVLWFDAHADINTPETSPSGNIHGMPVACVLGHGPDELRTIGFDGPKIAPDLIVQIGLRDIDRGEKAALKEHGIHAFTMADIDRRGMAEIVEEALKLVLEEADLLHVSFDIDVVDPMIAPGTGTPVRGGITYREAHLALELVAASRRLSSFELVEVNPILDHRNQTAELAVDLVYSAFGKTIL